MNAWIVAVISAAMPEGIYCSARNNSPYPRTKSNRASRNATSETTPPLWASVHRSGRRMLLTPGPATLGWHASMACGQRANTGDEFVEKLIGLHEHGKVSAAPDRNKSLLRRFHGHLVLSCKACRGGKVFFSLEDKHRDGEFEAEFLWPFSRCLADKMLAAKQVAFFGVVEVLEGIAGSYELEAQPLVQELVRTLESVCPSPLNTVSFARFVRRRPHALQVIQGLLI